MSKKYKSRNDHDYLETVKSLPTLKRKIEYTLSYYGLLIAGVVFGLIFVISFGIAQYRNSAPIYLCGDYINVYAIDELGAYENTYLEDTFLRDYMGIPESDRTRILYNAGYTIDMELMSDGAAGALDGYNTTQLLGAHMAAKDVDYYLTTEEAIDFLHACAALWDLREFFTEEEMALYADRICYTSTGVPVGIRVTDSHIIKNMGLSSPDEIYLAWFNNSDRKDNFRPFFDYVLNYQPQ